jgi:uncharacterized membrane protein
MVQESTSGTWDLRSMILEPPAASIKVYLLILLVVCIATSIKLARVWRGMVPFSHRPPTENPTYRRLLLVSAASLQHWIRFTCLVSAIFVSTAVYRISDSLIADQRMDPIFAISALSRQVSFTLKMGLLVALYAFLARWHLDKRIENLD